MINRDGALPGGLSVSGSVTDGAPSLTRGRGDRRQPGLRNTYTSALKDRSRLVSLLFLLLLVSDPI